MHDKLVAGGFQPVRFVLVRNEHIVRFSDDFTVDYYVGDGVYAVKAQYPVTEFAVERSEIPLVTALVLAEFVDIVRQIILEAAGHFCRVGFAAAKVGKAKRLEALCLYLVVFHVRETPFSFCKRDFFHCVVLRSFL